MMSHSSPPETSPQRGQRDFCDRELNGETPETTTFSVYSGMMDDPTSDRWRRLRDQGLGIIQHCGVVRHIEHDVKNTFEEKRDGNNRYQIHKKETPVGTIQQVHLNGWHYESFIKTPQDYKVMQWIVENTELVTCYEEYEKAEVLAGDYGVTILSASRTPAMTINVDWLEQNSSVLMLQWKFQNCLTFTRREKSLSLKNTG